MRTFDACKWFHCNMSAAYIYAIFEYILQQIVSHPGIVFVLHSILFVHIEVIVIVFDQLCGRCYSDDFIIREIIQSSGIAILSLLQGIEILEENLLVEYISNLLLQSWVITSQFGQYLNSKSPQGWSLFSIYYYLLLLLMGQ